MVRHEAARALAPGMSALDHPVLGLHHEAGGNNLRPQGLLRVWPSARAAVGSGALPMRSRHCWRSRSCMVSNTPPAAQRLQDL
jgi:hypothetical protein